jgi:hypothetical protein
VVTECDEVEGFTTFWSAWNDAPSDDMFGWSNPSRVDTAFSIRWVQDAFTSVVDAIRRAQLAIAATGEDIDDIDSFMLFDREFQRLEAPLTEVVKQGFASSSFQETLPLRGIWFSGDIAGNIALSEDLLAEKIWPEKHLAYPVEQRFFSSNKTLRSMQYTSVLLFFLLGAGLTIDTYRLHSYTQSAQKSWDAIFNNTTSDSSSNINSDSGKTKVYTKYCHSQGIETWRLLNTLTKLGDQPTTPTLISSWGGGQLDAMRQAAADSVFPSLLFPAYGCRLKIRAEELTQLTTKNIPRHASINVLSQHLTDYTDALMAYQQAQTQFIRLSDPLPNTTNVVRDLRQLTDYLYDGAIPASIDFGTALLVGGVMDTDYNHQWKANDLIDSTDQANYLAALSARVRNKISEQAQSPPLDDIRRSFLASSIETGQSTTQRFSLSSSKDMLDSINTFQQWLRYISQEWLKSTNYNSPCGRFHQRLERLNTELRSAAYSPLLLDTATAEFSDVNCDEKIRHQLINLNVSPFGKLFVENDNNNIVFSPKLNQWIDEFTALESMSILSYENILNASDRNAQKAAQQTAGKVVAWNTAPLSEAIDVMLEFQAFRQKWWKIDPNKRSEPFYSPALRERLREIVKQLINQSQVREYSRQPSLITRARDEESTLSASIVSFERAESMIRQLATLFQQEGDIANSTLLSSQTKAFVYEQLKVLTKVTVDNNLYTPLQRIDWKSDNLAQALFSYSDPASLSGYLESQRQRLSFLTQNYAKPLVSYLIDTHTIAETNNKARLWYNTLIEITQYDRQQPANDINLLQQYVTTDLGKQTWQNCDALLDQPQLVSSGGLFSQRHYDIDKKVRYVCKNYGKNRVVRQYFALAERFNQDIKGRFPFTDYSNSELVNLSPPVLHRFLDDYHTIWAEPDEGQSLLASLKRYLAKNPNSGLDHWLTFVKKVDHFAQFYQQVRDNDTAIVNLLVEFDSQSASSKGQDQIIEWQMRSGDQTLIFPNGDNQIQWQPGKVLSLSLRWAKGSEFFPLESFSSDFSVTTDRSVARFTSTSEWALFEWLQRFKQRSTKRKTRFEFAVPVGVKTDDKIALGAQKTAYTSRIHLTASAVMTTEGGKQQYLAIPLNLPRFAPGLPGGEQ